MVSLATSRTTSATRSNRWGFMALVRNPKARPRDGCEERPPSGRRRWSLPANRFPPWQFPGPPIDDDLGVDFSHGHIEGISQAIFDAPNYPTLVLETLGFANQQAHTNGADDHARSLTFAPHEITASVAPDRCGKPR